MTVGSVKWWDSVKGYGFLVAEDGNEYFAHFSEIQMDGFKDLVAGQEVQFDVAAGANGKTQAVCIRIVDNGRLELATGTYQLQWDDGREVYLNLAQVLMVEGKPGETWFVHMTGRVWGEELYYKVSEKVARDIVHHLG